MSEPVSQLVGVRSALLVLDAMEARDETEDRVVRQARKLVESLATLVDNQPLWDAVGRRGGGQRVVKAGYQALRDYLGPGLSALAKVFPPQPPPPQMLPLMLQESVEALTRVLKNPADGSPGTVDGDAELSSEARVAQAQSQVKSCVTHLQQLLGTPETEGAGSGHRPPQGMWGNVRAVVRRVGRAVKELLPFLTAASLVAAGTAFIQLNITNEIAAAAVGVLTAKAQSLATALDTDIRAPGEEPPAAVADKAPLAGSQFVPLHHAHLLLQLHEAQKTTDPDTLRAALEHARVSLEALKDVFESDHAEMTQAEAQLESDRAGMTQARVQGAITYIDSILETSFDAGAAPAGGGMKEIHARVKYLESALIAPEISSIDADGALTVLEGSPSQPRPPVGPTSGRQRNRVRRTAAEEQSSPEDTPSPEPTDLSTNRPPDPWPRF